MSKKKVEKIERIVREGASETPLPDVSEQLVALKQRHPGMLLLFRDGDRCWFPDAEQVAQVDKKLAMPAEFHAARIEEFLRQLLKSGFRVAVCEPVR